MAKKDLRSMDGKDTRTLTKNGTSGRMRLLAGLGVVFAAFVAVGSIMGGIRSIVEGYKIVEARFFPPATTPVVFPRLSIAVLPLANRTNDPDQDYFADGITDNLTTDLSRIPDSFVIARNSAFTYKGKAIDLKQVGRELGVHYILEGSVQRIMNQIRINIQLIDTTTGATLWADRFEDDRANLLQVQGEITSQIARLLNVELIKAEGRRAKQERPDNPDAVDFTMRGWAILNGHVTREATEQAINTFDNALKLNPDNTQALVGLAQGLTRIFINRWTSEPEKTLSRADDAVTRAISSAPNNANAHYMKGEVLRMAKNIDASLAEYKMVINIDPNNAPAYAAMGHALIWAGRSKEVFLIVEKGILLSPRDPLLYAWYFTACHSFTHLARDDDAIEWCQKSIATGNKFWFAYVDLASGYGWKEQKAEAKAAVTELLKLKPNYTVQKLANESFSDNPIFLNEYQRIVEGVRKAGLPEY